VKGEKLISYYSEQLFLGILAGLYQEGGVHEISTGDPGGEAPRGMKEASQTTPLSHLSLLH
jgi:hypothetical protein